VLQLRLLPAHVQCSPPRFLLLGPTGGPTSISAVAQTDRRSQTDLDLDAWIASAGTGDQFVALSMSRPQTVLSWCDEDLDRLVGILVASYVWQARALAAREVGDGTKALRYIRRSVVLADQEGSAERSGDVRASLATTLAEMGRGRQAMAVLDEADQILGGAPGPRVQMRRGAVLRTLGLHEEALVALGAAITALRACGDKLWEARALSNRAIVHLDLGSPHLADRDLSRAQKLYALTEQRLETATSVHNRGWAAYRFGQLPEALERLAEAESLYGAAGAHQPTLAMDRCAVLLAAGLFHEAYQRIDECLVSFETSDSRTTFHAEALLIGARAAIAAKVPGRAIEHAADSERIFTKQGNLRAARLARLEGLRARWANGRATGSLRRKTVELADELAALDAPEAVDARLLAGRLALAAGMRGQALEQLRLAAAARSRGPALLRTTGWVARLLAEETAGSRNGALRAARSGLRVLDQHRLTLGATELRAHATSHGSELVAGALRQVVAGRDARQLLAWSERWRAMTVDARATRAADSVEALAELGELREVTHQLTSGSAEGAQLDTLTRRQRQLESAVLARARHSRGGGNSASTDTFDLAGLLDSLAGRQLVSIVEVDATLHAVLVARGRVRSFVLGPAAEAAREVEFARFGLRAAVLGRGGAGVPARLAATAELAQQVLLGPVVAALDDTALVLVPPTRLQATPWALLPALADRAFSVAPSARAWARALATPPPARRQVVLVRGPGLAGGGAEVPVLAGLHPGATVLTDVAGSVAATLAALDGAWLGHVAAHGTFRADNPMFSALHLNDGPLTIHDLERLGRPPHRLMLSACEAGLGTSVGSDELLGLVSALMTVGSAGVLASVLPVGDTTVVELSVVVHQRLLAGDDLAHAALRARQHAAGDPVAAATAAAFAAFGGA
jgi:tetratricopeptide (TPR) repeat protein